MGRTMAGNLLYNPGAGGQKVRQGAKRKPCVERLVPEPAKYPGEAAKLALLILEPGVQRTVGDRGGCSTSIEGVCLGND
jgi:hypothetical protein